MSDHLDSMDHAELASKTRELLAAAVAVEKREIGCFVGLSDAVKAFQPSPLDKLRQTLREQGWHLHLSCAQPSTALPLIVINRPHEQTGEERWVLPCQP